MCSSPISSNSISYFILFTRTYAFTSPFFIISSSISHSPTISNSQSPHSCTLPLIHQFSYPTIFHSFHMRILLENSFINSFIRPSLTPQSFLTRAFGILCFPYTQQTPEGIHCKFIAFFLPTTRSSHQLFSILGDFPILRRDSIISFNSN